MTNCFSSVFKSEGAGAFYSGVVPRLWRVIPGQGILFMSFEQISAGLEKIL
jgi:solute carrier family 25 citrate transporter 1